jgi:hypothetical protein
LRSLSKITVTAKYPTNSLHLIHFKLLIIGELGS